MKSAVLLCMGTRPEIIKMAPVYRALQSSPLAPRIVHTGQHEEMAWPLYRFFGLTPQYSLDLARDSSSLSRLSARLLEELDRLLRECQPAAVLVQGDTTSALMAALSAYYRQIPVGHVEAGLRTGVAYDPFPEEKNRELIGRIARWHFAPTRIAEENLLREGIARQGIHCIGNTIVDAMAWGMQMVQAAPEDGRCLLPDELSALPAATAGRRLLLVTAHRRENWGASIASIALAIRSALEAHPDLCAVWPLHVNPEIRQTVHAVFDTMPDEPAARAFLCEPVNYPVLLWLMSRTWLILTDSGGMQEEAVSANVPVFVLRATTERPELITAGGGILVGTDAQAIRAKLDRLHADDAQHRHMRQAVNPFGDGHAAEYLRDILAGPHGIRGA